MSQESSAEYYEEKAELRLQAKDLSAAAEFFRKAAAVSLGAGRRERYLSKAKELEAAEQARKDAL